MGTTKQKQKQYTAQEMNELLGAYKRRAVPQKQWCKEHGIAVSTLHKWLNGDKEQAGIVCKRKATTPAYTHKQKLWFSMVEAGGTRVIPQRGQA